MICGTQSLPHLEPVTMTITSETIFSDLLYILVLKIQERALPNKSSWQEKK